MQLRDARPDEVDALCAFVDRVHFRGEALRTRDLQAQRDRWAGLIAAAADAEQPCAAVIVGVDQDRIRGVLALTQGEPGEAVVDVWLLEQSVLGTMVGHRLFLHLWERLSTRDCERIVTWIPTSSSRARGAFLRQGFRLVPGQVREPSAPLEPRRLLYAKQLRTVD